MNGRKRKQNRAGICVNLPTASQFPAPAILAAYTAGLSPRDGSLNLTSAQHRSWIERGLAVWHADPTAPGGGNFVEKKYLPTEYVAQSFEESMDKIEEVTCGKREVRFARGMPQPRQGHCRKPFMDQRYDAGGYSQSGIALPFEGGFPGVCQQGKSPDSTSTALHPTCSAADSGFYNQRGRLDKESVRSEKSERGVSEIAVGVDVVVGKDRAMQDLWTRDVETHDLEWDYELERHFSRMLAKQQAAGESPRFVGSSSFERENGEAAKMPPHLPSSAKFHFASNENWAIEHSGREPLWQAMFRPTAEERGDREIMQTILEKDAEQMVPSCKCILGEISMRLWTLLTNSDGTGDASVLESIGQADREMRVLSRFREASYASNNRVGPGNSASEILNPSGIGATAEMRQVVFALLDGITKPRADGRQEFTGSL